MSENNPANTEKAIEAIIADYGRDRVIDNTDICNLPDKDEIIRVTKELVIVLFPGYHRDREHRFLSMDSHVRSIVEDAAYRLRKQVRIVLQARTADGGSSSESDGCSCRYSDETESRSAEIVAKFLEKIPKIREYLGTDLDAGFEGDPAAVDREEIIYCYPGYFAIAVYRLAHELLLLGVPLIPRIMTEYAHSQTGTDIHPGATIGKYFFIDHATGIVIGETTVIGEHVKIYQGVTLGGLSTRGGQSMRGEKRHPTIKDNVTIYSGASILGGETVIGRNVVIGGNAFITESVPDDTKVIVKSQELTYE